MIAHPIPKPRLKDNPSLTGKEKTGRNGKAPVAQKTVMVRGIRRRSLLRAEYIAMLRACDAFSFLHRAVSRYFGTCKEKDSTAHPIRDVKKRSLTF